MTGRARAIVRVLVINLGSTVLILAGLYAILLGGIWDIPPETGVFVLTVTGGMLISMAFVGLGLANIDRQVTDS